MADSRDVAACFGKEHRSVLQSIPELNRSDDFRRHNFVLISYIDDFIPGGHSPARGATAFQAFK